MAQIITLLTDFGTADGYVAAMKGVVLSLAPETQVVDVSHEIRPQDIRAGAWALMQYWRWFPSRTIHVAVVDPGVGTDRNALLVLADNQWFLAPDNGLLSGVLRQARIVELRCLKRDLHHPAGCSATFHGRDIFAYAAGLLACGAKPEAISEKAHNVIISNYPTVAVHKDRVVGEVIHVDRFGNLITNITRALLTECGWTDFFVRLNGRSEIRLHKTYAEAPEGSLIALINSSDVLEIAIVRGSAAERTQAGTGAIVEIVSGSSTVHP